jgi:hypothetical protein
MLFSFASCKCPVESENVVIEPKAKAYINIIHAVNEAGPYKVEAWNRVLIEKLEPNQDNFDYVSIGAGECDLSFTPENDSLFVVKYPITPVQGEAYTLVLSGYKTPRDPIIFINDRIDHYRSDRAYIRFVNAISGYNYDDTDFWVKIISLETEKIASGEYTVFFEVDITRFDLELSAKFWMAAFELTPEAGKLYTIVLRGDKKLGWYDFKKIVTDKK